jgi:hypothetical protein
VRPQIEHAVDTYLAVVLFAQTAIPLAAGADGLVAFFGVGALINDQGRVFAATKALVGTPGDLGIHQRLIPRATGDELLHPLVAIHAEIFVRRAPFAKVLIHALHIFARGLGEQACDIALGEKDIVG